MDTTQQIDWQQANEEKPVPGHPEVAIERFTDSDQSPGIGLIVNRPMDQPDGYWFFGIANNEDNDARLTAGELRAVGLGGIVQDDCRDNVVPSMDEFAAPLVDLLCDVLHETEQQLARENAEREADEELQPYEDIDHWVVVSSRGFRNELELIPCANRSSAREEAQQHTYSCVVDRDMARTLLLEDQDANWADGRMGCRSSIVAPYRCTIVNRSSERESE